MVYDEHSLLTFLDEHHIAYQRVEHPPVYTCEEADRLRMPLPAVHTKNLFLRDEGKKHFYLAMTRCEKRVDTSALGKALGVRKLHLASAQAMQDLLGVTPGAVTVLALINDYEHKVELLVDEEIWGEENFTCHPLVNTATLVMTKNGLVEFFRLTGHPVRIIKMQAM
jgi:Ala-tRNA(Pro) deacylase